jgi:hypothetical protein
MNGAAETGSATAAGQALFGDTLACDEIRPAAFEPGIDHDRLRAHAANGEALLRALAVVEDGLRTEEPEPSSDNTLHRLEAKLDLLTALVASLVPTHDSLAPAALRWSARGACLVSNVPAVAGSDGTLRLQPADWLPSTLVLPVRVLACTDEGTPNEGAPVEGSSGPGRWRVWLAFHGLSPALEAALERHLFRVHRRAVAETRRR